MTSQRTGLESVEAGGLQLIAPVQQPASARVFFTTRAGGTSAAPYASLNLATHVGDDARNVAENRALVSEALGISPRWATCAQVHGGQVAVAGEGHLDSVDADAMITSERGVALAISTADCVPIALVGDAGIAAVHAGWRGLSACVIEAAVAAIGDLDDAPLSAYIGPCIGPCHFEVGNEVEDAFREEHPTAPSFGVEDDGRLMFDLPAAAEWILASLQVRVVASSGLCTHCDERFFSYRRDGPVTGRQAMLVWRD